LLQLNRKIIGPHAQAMNAQAVNAHLVHKTMLGRPAGGIGDPGGMATGRAQPIPVRRCVIATDIERYGQRSAPDQYEAQRAYASAIDRAADDAGCERAGWIRQAAGDGELIVCPADVFEARVLAGLVPALAARLREYNRSRLPEFRVRLRMAIHYGLVHLDGPTGYPGAGPVVAARLVSADPLRAALAARPETNLAVAVSATVYQDVVANRYEGLRPEQFRPVPILDPAKNFAADAWIHTPETDEGSAQ
jgi:class 3 adenylate cyclase